jgi:hypothetical protein
MALQIYEHIIGLQVAMHVPQRVNLGSTVRGLETYIGTANCNSFIVLVELDYDTNKIV